MVVRLFFLTALLLFSVPAAAQELSIAQAYKAIPHAHTPFDPKQSRAGKTDAKYLDHLFFVTDMAMRARVQTLINFRAGRTDVLKKYNEDIENLILSFEIVQTPAHLGNVQETVISAIRDQQAFFNDWAKTAGTPLFDAIKKSYTSNPAVISSHQKLIKSYAELKSLYPGETEYNTKAFFNHLCALDFI